MACVYALALESSPEDYRYIGRTSYSTARRLSDHWSQAKRGRNTHLYKWMRNSLSNKEKIIIVVIEDNLSFNESSSREVYWIKHYRMLGYKLTNSTDGGEGALGFSLSAESRAKISASLRGKPLSEETKAKISASLRGRTHSPEHIEKNRQVHIGHAVSEETRAKIGLAGRGRVPSPETRAKRSESLKKAYREGRHPGTKGRVLSAETRAKISATLKSKNLQKREHLR